MLTRNLLFFLAIVIFASSCASNKAPDGWLKKEQEFVQHANGAWATVTFAFDSIYYHCRDYDNIIYEDLDIIFDGVSDLYDSTITIGGELIATDSLNFYLLTMDHGVKCIVKTKTLRIDIQTTDNNVGGVSAWSILGTIGTISHGFVLVFSAPVWLITGIGASSSESMLNRYDMSHDDYYTGIEWDIVNMYCRFPQGLSPGIDLAKLKMPIHLDKEKAYDNLYYR